MKRWIEKRPEIRKMKKWEASWLAGVIDGEGSIGLYDYGREGRRVQILVSNTDESFVRRVRETIGCGSSIMRLAERLSGHSGRKRMYMYSLKGSNRCYWVLKQIIPFLIIKKQKAIDINHELEEKPFGRWVNATAEYKKIFSEKMRERWKNPTMRLKLLEGMKRYHINNKITYVE